MTRWSRGGAKALNPAQRGLVEQALDYARQHSDGLPETLFTRVEGLLHQGEILTRSMKQRARYIQLPGLGTWIELEPDALGLNLVYSGVKALRSGADPSLVEAKVEQGWLFLATALVHEGTHALHGLSWRRRDDERLAYGAEIHWLDNVLRSREHPLVRSAAISLRQDAVRDAKEMEGLDFV